MNGKEKKVVVFIVEGPSDESAVGLAVKEFFPMSEVQFHVIHGDITLKNGSNPSSIIKRINECITMVKTRYRYQTGDIERIIHLVDTDGVFIQDSRLVKRDCYNARYYPDHIETPDVDALTQRNKLKSEVLYKLSTTGKINRIPYSIYYMSCNLEHVLYHKLQDFSDDEKWEFSDRFSEAYEGNLNGFVSFISGNGLAVTGSYKDTWKFIEKDANSLKRHTNFHLLFSVRNT